jgi:hypothetical protein
MYFGLEAEAGITKKQTEKRHYNEGVTTKDSPIGKRATSNARR